MATSRLMLRRYLWAGLMLILVLTILSGGAMTAQDEGLPELRINEAISSTITTPGEKQAWRFFALQNEMLTLRVTGDDDFDPVITLFTDQNALIISNDDYSYTDTRDAMLEGITIPATGYYRVEVAGYMGSIGDFTLIRLPGYGEIAAGPDLADYVWRGSERISYFAGDEGVSVEITGAGERGYIVDSESEPYRDRYVEINVPRIEGVNGWIAGLVLRWESEDKYYSAEVSSQGFWRFIAVENDQTRVIRDWVAHPALESEKTSFRFGVLMRGDGFEAFFDGQLVGQAQDNTIESGNIGISVVGSDVVGSRTTVFVDGIIVTEPTQVNGELVFPQQLIMGSSGQIVHELERRGVIPLGGSMALTVAESFIERRSEGVDTLSLGRGARYRNFSLGTTVTLEQAADGLSGCGLMLRWRDETNYMVAFKDTQGGFGLSERRGNEFSEGLFGENPEWVGVNSDMLLVIAHDNQVHYFVNGVYVGAISVSPIDAIVGNAILNYQPLNAICRFEETWLWQFD